MEQIKQKFLELERNYNFNIIEYDNISVWQHIRNIVYGKVLEEKRYVNKADTIVNVMEGIVPKRKIRLIYNFIRTNVRHPFRFVYNTLTRNMLFAKRRDILFVVFPVRRKVGKYNKEPYMDDYIRLLDKDKYNVIEWSPKVSYFVKKPMTRHLHFVSEEWMLASANCYKNYNADSIYSFIYDNFLLIIEQEFDISFSNENRLIITKVLKQYLSKREVYKEYISKIIKRFDPKAFVIYNMEEYYAELWVEMMKEHGVKTVEMQHGFFAAPGIRYNIKLDEKCNDSVPDYFFAFGEGSKDYLNIGQDHAYVVGRPISDNSKKKAINKGQEKHILFVGCDNEDFFDIAEAVSGYYSNTSTKVAYRPHPVENGDSKFRFKQDESSILIFRDGSAEEWIKWSDVVVGVMSTVLIDAYAGGKTVIQYRGIDMQLGGIYKLIQQKKVFYEAKDLNELCELLSENHNITGQVDDNWLIAKNSSFLFNNAIRNIL